MCGRYALNITATDLSQIFDVIDAPELPPRFNISPTQTVAAVRLDDAMRRRVAMLRWGLIPFWAKDASIGSKCINARADGIDQKPAFRAAFKKRRCIIPANGFFEWKTVDPKGPRGRPLKQPWFITVRGGPFGMAGLFERWREPATGAEIETCTILTTEPNSWVASLHDRMPVILSRERFGEWLDPATPPDTLKGMLVPIAASAMHGHPVSTIVNNPRVDDSRCIETAPAGS